jgi:hypothetical protein
MRNAMHSGGPTAGGTNCLLANAGTVQEFTKKCGHRRTPEGRGAVRAYCERIFRARRYVGLTIKVMWGPQPTKIRAAARIFRAGSLFLGLVNRSYIVPGSEQSREERKASLLAPL